MTEFTNVSIGKKANVYFGGKVTSRVLVFADGSEKTLGIMLPGEYVFNTAVEELMEVTAGGMEVLLPGESEWKTVTEGNSFVVPGKAQFEVRIAEVTDYCCSYVK